MVNRAAIIGDVHGEASTLAAVLDFLKTLPETDAIFCTGDVPDTNRMPETQRCCELLADNLVVTIRGNHDRWFTGDDPTVLAFVKTLPATREFETPQGPLLLCHGVGSDDMAGIYPGRADGDVIPILRSKKLDSFAYIVAGHTHKRMVRKIGDTVVINPGTLLADAQPGFAVANFVSGSIQFYDVASFTHSITKAETFPLSTE